MQRDDFFSGVKVIELASVLAGPSVGQFFAELGAEVIKIENPATGGDVTRSWRLKDESADGLSAYFSSINWGKRSISLDISQPEGLHILYRLVERAEIVIASYKPGDAERLGVDYSSLKKVNEHLIYGRITGYGDTNGKVGYDAIIQAEAGFMSMNGEPEGHPTKMPVALMDILAGHHLKEAILLQYIQRLKTGLGGQVSVSLIEAAVASLANQAANWLIAGKIPSRQGSSHPNIAPYGDIFITKDQKEIILAVGTDRQFQKLCYILEVKELSSDPNYLSNAERVKNRQALKAGLQNRINQYERDYLLRKFYELKVPAGAVRNVREALENQEVEDLLIAAEGLLGLRNFAANFEGAKPQLSHLLPPPMYGQHTSQILAEELGYTGADIDRLYQDNII